MARLEQRHRPHAEPRDPCRAGVPGDVVGWRGRTGQNELARLLTIVDRATQVVPQRRFDLPLVKEPRDRTVQHEAGIDRDRTAGVVVDVQQDLAAGHLSRRGRLAATLRALDHDGPRRGEAGRQLRIDDTRTVGLRERIGVARRLVLYRKQCSHQAFLSEFAMEWAVAIE